jgi:hypothetical protein
LENPVQISASAREPDRINSKSLIEAFSLEIDGVSLLEKLP